MTLDERHHVRFCFTVASLCLVWYSSSSACNIVNKLILEQFPFPLTISMSNLLGTSVYSLPLLRQLRISHGSLKLKFVFIFLIPIAIGKIIAVSSSYISLWKVPVSYSHTVKATMPLFTVICARLLLGEKQGRAVYISLMPIICGVIVASLTELSFNLFGLLSALCSTFTYALLNSFVKKVLQDTRMHHVKLLSLSSQLACVIFLPVWLFKDGAYLWSDTFDSENGKNYVQWSVFFTLAFSGLLNFVQNMVTFTLIHKLTALSYSVANAAKRIVIITASLLALGNPVTPMNIFGMLLASTGVLLYNRAKQSSQATPPFKTILPDDVTISLPLSMSDPLFTQSNFSPDAAGNDAKKLSRQNGAQVDHKDNSPVQHLLDVNSERDQKEGWSLDHRRTGFTNAKFMGLQDA